MRGLRAFGGESCLRGRDFRPRFVYCAALKASPRGNGPEAAQPLVIVLHRGGRPEGCRFVGLLAPKGDNVWPKRADEVSSCNTNPARWSQATRPGAAGGLLSSVML